MINCKNLNYLLMCGMGRVQKNTQLGLAKREYLKQLNVIKRSLAMKDMDLQTKEERNNFL